MNIVLVVEGTLKSPVSEAPIVAGVGLYKALVEVEHRLFLLCEQLDEVLRDWLKYNCLPGFVGLAQIQAADLQDATLHRTLGRLRITGPVDLVIDADPGRCADSFRHGYTVLPFLAPAYARPQWRPDHDASPRPWDVLEAEVRRQRALDAAARAAKNEEE